MMIQYLFILYVCLSETGKPTTIRSLIYIESFGNIEEANMVSNIIPKEGAVWSRFYSSHKFPNLFYDCLYQKLSLTTSGETFAFTPNKYTFNEKKTLTAM